MKKSHKIIYWVATVWLALGMASSGIVQLMQLEEENAMFDRLGYPYYLATILGIWKLLGVVAILIPRSSLLKEWAYAGFFFVATGAIASHMAISDPLVECAPTVLMLVLTVLSWWFRPASRRTEVLNPLA